MLKKITKSNHVVCFIIYQDTSDVIVLAGFLFLAEVSNDVEAVLVALTHDVEQEGIGVVVKRLVVEKQLCEQAQVLGVRFVLPSVDFEKRNVALPVNLVSGRMSQVAL